MACDKAALIKICKYFGKPYMNRTHVTTYRKYLITVMTFYYHKFCAVLHLLVPKNISATF